MNTEQITDVAEGDERQLRAMVALVDAQSEQLNVLRDAVDTLEAKVAIRSELDMIVAQELRMPLSIITDSLEELGALKPGDEDFVDVLERTKRNANYLTETIDELLRPWRGEGPVVDRKQLEMVDLDSALERTLIGFSDTDRPRVSVSGVAGVSMRTSSPRLNGILVNVIEHALRNSTGAIDIHASHTDDGTLRLQIVEYAPSSIDPAKPDNVLRPYADGTATHPQQIGLYLVRMLARSLGGDVSIVPGDKGSMVTTVELPQRRASEGDPQPQS
jgi:two-component system, sensor histidine kinase and response regulator